MTALENCLPVFSRIKAWKYVNVMTKRGVQRDNMYHYASASFVTNTSTSSQTKNTLSRIDATRKWFKTIVIGPQKLCPFAPPLIKEKGLLRIVASAAKTANEAVEEVAAEVSFLMDDEIDRHIGKEKTNSDNTIEFPEESSILKKHETTLIVFDKKMLSDAMDFRSFVRLSWRLQLEAVVDTGRGEEVQLVLFHPDATHDTYTEFASYDKDDANASVDAAHYTIRSPYPTVHLLREVDVMRAVTNGYPGLETLPARNKTKMRKLGWKDCASRLEECYYVVGNNE